MSILINGMEMPTNCGDCYFEQIGAEEEEEDEYGDTCISYCLLTEWRIALSNRDDMKLPSCPLVEIVTCRECIHFEDAKDDICGYCYEHERDIKDNDFCSYGERRADEHNTERD